MLEAQRVGSHGVMVALALGGEGQISDPSVMPPDLNANASAYQQGLENDFWPVCTQWHPEGAWVWAQDNERGPRINGDHNGGIFVVVFWVTSQKTPFILYLGVYNCCE